MPDYVATTPAQIPVWAQVWLMLLQLGVPTAQLIALFKSLLAPEDYARLRLLDAEWDALVKRWVALGQWIATLEAYDAVGEVPRRRRMAGCRHDGVWRAKQASAARAHWARVKAIATDGCQERQAT